MLVRSLRAVAVLLMVALVTFVCFKLLHANAATAGLVYLVAILLIASVWGFFESMVASVVAMVCFNFYFLPPVGTLTIAEPQNWVALIAFFVTSSVASQLSNRAKRRALEATARQQEMERLYSLSRSILLMDGVAVPKQVITHVAEVFGADFAALFDRRADEYFLAGPEEADESEVKRRLREVATQGTQLSDPMMIAAIRLGAEPIGALAIRGTELSDSALQSLLNLIAIGLERAHHQDAANRAEAARQSELLKSALLDAIAHEFKTPLTAIKAGTTALLSGKRERTPEEKELISIMDEEADHLSNLVTEAIQMARVEAGGILLKRTTGDIRWIIEKVVTSLGQALQGREVQIEIPDDLPETRIDNEMVELAIRQLLDNARKYSPPESPILVKVQSTPDELTVMVEDRGPGIPESEQARIFDKFYRGKVAPGQIPGSGMGLAIAREVITAHHGRIWMETRRGGGSSFRFSIPTGKVEVAQ